MLCSVASCLARGHLLARVGISSVEIFGQGSRSALARGLKGKSGGPQDTASARATKPTVRNKNNNTWISDNKNYPDEEKKIVLKILEIAGGLASSNSQK